MEMSTRQIERIKKDNKILQERAERYLKDLKILKTWNDALIQENLNLETELINLRKIVKYYENRTH